MDTHKSKVLFKKTYSKETDELTLPRIVGGVLIAPRESVDRIPVTAETTLESKVSEDGSIEVMIIGEFRTK